MLVLGMLSIYDAEPTERCHYKMSGTNHMQLAYSYNGRNWYRASREPFMLSAATSFSMRGMRKSLHASTTPPPKKWSTVP